MAIMTTVATILAIKVTACGDVVVVDVDVDDDDDEEEEEEDGEDDDDDIFEGIRAVILLMFWEKCLINTVYMKQDLNNT